MKKYEELLDKVLKEYKKATKKCHLPDMMYHPDYGYIIRNGEVTEAGIEWYKDTFEKGNKK